MNTTTVVAISSIDGAEREGMDWYGWLSTAGLEPTLAYEYALLFAHNELDQEDIPHFDHAFLLSLGVTVGKHRLQILHLAKKERWRSHPRPVTRLLSAAGRARRCLAKCLRSLAAGDGVGKKGPSAALAAAQRDLFGGGGGQYWRSAMLKREKKLVLLKQGRLMLTDGGIRVAEGPLPPLSPFSRSQSMSPVVYGGLGGGSGDGMHWGGGVAGEADQERRWDAMFQDLKPT